MLQVIQLGPIVISVPLVVLLLAFLVSFEVFLRLSDAAGLSLALVAKSSWALLLGVILGGRLGAVVAHYRIYLQDLPRIPVLWDGNFSFLGACLGFGIVLYVLARRRNMVFLPWIDALLPAVTLGLAVDWIGQFLGASQYGRPTSLPWGVTFQGFGVRYAVPVHPVQIYAAIFYAILTVVLLSMRQRQPRTGTETLVGIFASGMGIFFLEFFRGDFAIAVFVKLTDFLLFALLFVSLGILALLEQKLPHRSTALYAGAIALVTSCYLLARPWITTAEFEWRFAQFLSVLAMLATAVYVVVQRWKYPHL